MCSRRVFCLVALAASGILFLTCSSDDKATVPEPPKLVSVQGTIVPPDSFGMDPGSLEVLCGDRSVVAGGDGTFAIGVWDDSPAALIAVDSAGNPVLMSIVGDPAVSPHPVVDARSTALALVYLNPMVCHCSQSETGTALAAIEGLASFAAFADSVEERLALRLPASR